MVVAANFSAFGSEGGVAGEAVGDDPTTTTGEPAFAYDGAGRLRSIPGIVSDVRYHAIGDIAQLTNANGTTTTRTLNPARAWLDTDESRSPEPVSRPVETGCPS